MVKLTAILKNHYFQELSSLSIALIVYSLVLINRSIGFIGKTGIKVEINFGTILPFIMILVYLAFIVPGWMGKTLSATVTLALFGLTLVGIWVSGQTQGTIISGFIPIRDASEYYVDALRLLGGQNISIFSARRPLFTGLLAVFLRLTDRNLMLSLGVFAAINGLTCYLAAKEIRRIYGPATGVLVFTLLLLFYRLHSGSTMTEQVGISAGVLGFTLLWQGIINQRIPLILASLFTITIALNARAGAFFILPILLMWVVRVYRIKEHLFSKKFLLIGSGLIISGFLINLIMVRLLGSLNSVPFANFAHSLYGLAAGGKSWAYIYNVHPEVFVLEEPMRSNTIYQLAFNLIRNDPKLIVQGVFICYQKFFTSPYYGAFSYVIGENIRLSIVVQITLFILSAFGILKWALKRDDLIMSMVMAGILGILVSVPFAPPGDASKLRPYAASIGFLAILPSLGLHWILEKFRFKIMIKPEAIVQNSNLTIMFNGIYIAAMIIGPLIVKATGSLPDFPDTTCPSEMRSVVIDYDSGPHITIVPDDQKALAQNNEFNYSYFKHEMHDISGPIINWPKLLIPPQSMLLTLDYRLNQTVFLVIPPSLLPKNESMLEICGIPEQRNRLESYQIFYAKSINVLNSQ